MPLYTTLVIFCYGSTPIDNVHIVYCIIGTGENLKKCCSHPVFAHHSVKSFCHKNLFVLSSVLSMQSLAYLQFFSSLRHVTHCKEPTFKMHSDPSSGAFQLSSIWHLSTAALWCAPIHHPCLWNTIIAVVVAISNNCNFYCNKENSDGRKVQFTPRIASLHCSVTVLYF